MKKVILLLLTFNALFVSAQIKIPDGVHTFYNKDRRISKIGYFVNDTINEGITMKMGVSLEYEKNGLVSTIQVYSGYKFLEEIFNRETFEAEKRRLENHGKKVEAELENQKIETHKQAEEIEILNKDKEIQKMEIKNAQLETDKKNQQLAQEKQQRLFLYGGLILIVAFSAFIFNRFRVTKKQKNIIENKEKEAQRQNVIITEQKHLVEEKQKEILDSINYAQRIQQSQLPTEVYIDKCLKRLQKQW